MKAMSTLRAFEVLLFEGRSVLAPAQWGTESERVIQMKRSYLAKI